MIKTILLDLDGVLVLACELHYQALNRALQEVAGYEINRYDHENVLNGLPTKVKLNKLVEAGKIQQADIENIFYLKQHFTKLVIAEQLQPDEEKISMHHYLKSQGIWIACVTNSIEETARMMLLHTGQLEYIDLLITNDMIKKAKPCGEGYVRAMVSFQSMPNETLIVEDSQHGILAAHSTGSNVWEVKGCEEVTLEGLKEQLRKYA